MKRAKFCSGQNRTRGFSKPSRRPSDAASRQPFFHMGEKIMIQYDTSAETGAATVQSHDILEQIVEATVDEQNRSRVLDTLTEVVPAETLEREYLDVADVVSVAKGKIDKLIALQIDA